MAQSTSAQGASCLICRSRKVKCDAAVPTCHNCETLGLDCPGYRTDTGGAEAQKRLEADTLETIYRASGVEKRRVGSCEACRRAKGRCDKARPTCSRCLQRSLPCHYPRRQRPSATVTLSNAPMGSPRNDEPRLDMTDSSPGASMSPLDPTARIQDKSLPRDRQILKALTGVYFDRVATLRCLGFIHKPSFNHSLDKGTLVEDYGEAILYAICAHGLRIKELGNSSNVTHIQADNPNALARIWAEESQALVMKQISKPTLMTAMTLVLLCEFALQTGQDALAFMLCGCCHSAARLLAFDRPSQPSNSGEKTAQDSIIIEARRRILWSCFILDSIVGSGVNENLRWRDETPQIPLPNSDQGFLSQSPTPETPLFLPRCFDIFPSSEELQRFNLRSHLIYMMCMRTRVLRLIRTSPDGIDIPDAQSSFSQTLHALEAWSSSISTQLQLTEFSIYVHKELNTLESLFYLHLAYHTLICDLTRISVPGFDFPLAAAFRLAPREFLLQCQDLCRHHAAQITNILGMMAQHLSPVFVDCTTRMAAYEATKIMIVYAALTRESGVDIQLRLKEDITFSMKVLSEQTCALVQTRVCRALTRLLRRFGFNDIVNNVCTTPPSHTEGDPAEVSGPPEAFYLSDLAPFRRAFDDVNQNPQRRESAAGSLADSSQQSLTQDAPVVRHWSQPTAQQPLNSSVMAASQMMIPVGDYTQATGSMSNEITWDLFSLPDWLYQQQDMDFGA